MGIEDGRGDPLLGAQELSMCIADAVREPVAILDTRLRILAVNEAFALSFAISPDSARGVPIAHLDEGAWNRPELLAAVGDVLQGGEPLRDLELESVFSGPGTRILRINARPFVHQGTVMGVVLAVEDLTEERRLERNLLQSQKLETVGRLAGGIAHDFNNQLAAIIGFSELAIQSIKWDDGVRSHLLEILKAGQSAASMTQQLLAFSRKRRSPPKPLNVNGIILDWERMLKRILGERIQFRANYGTALRSVVIDAAQMGQVVLNLVVNARDAMPHGGILKLVTRNTVRRTASENGQAGASRRHFILLEISDTGSGISPEALPRIFEPWFTTKEEGRGTGLGLATVKGIVEQAGGEIEVESKIDNGTVFRLFLPAEDEEELELGA